jgi:hypothetical protein
MSQQLDAQGEAHEALGTAVASYGQRVLNDPHTLGNLVADLLPDLPRERSLLVTAAEAGIAAEMRQHVEERHVDPDTAAQLMARMLSERRAIDPAASLWVASEYAQALGYQVRPYTAAVLPGPPQQVSPASSGTSAVPSAAEAPTVQLPSPRSWPPAGQAPQLPGPRSWPPAGQAPQLPSPRSWPPAGQAPQLPSQRSWPPAGPEPPRPPGQFWQPSLPQQPWATGGPAPQSWPPAGAPPQSWPPAGPPSGQSWPPPQPSSGGPRSSWSGRKRGLIAAATAVALIGGYLIAATFAHTFPFTKSRPVAASSPAQSPRPTPKPTRSATPTPTGPRLAAGVAPLVQLLPVDIGDPTTQCQTDPPPYSWDMPGRVTALACNDPGLPKGKLYAYQMDSQADYEATWQSYSKVAGFTGSSPGQDCPPAKGGVGTFPTDSKMFPHQSGQVLWCVMVDAGNGPQPTYTWTLPGEDAFFVAAGAPKSSFAALDKWWRNNSLPLASPSPSASS